jgi:hypothetical protein
MLQLGAMIFAMSTMEIELNYEVSLMSQLLFADLEKLTQGPSLLLRLVASDTNCNHCVFVSKGWIFYSTYHSPMPFSQKK